jgi:HPt (histidine-containing phosphotransfer) domain-containing protein
MNTQTRLLLAALVLSAAVPAHAQTRPVDLSLASLEDLMNIEITSASRKERRAEDVPAAVYVIPHDDIRRSGMTSVPDLLRLVPGVQVAHINSNKWAVSVRGFNGLYSNKLLVLVDGRSVYSPLFSTVMWDTEDLMLEGALLNRLSGDAELMTDVIRIFLDGCPARLAAINDAVTSRNPEALRTAAHALRGAAGNLSAIGLFEAAQVLERIGAESRMDAADGACRQFSVEASQVIDVLQDRAVPVAKEPHSCGS